MNCNFQLFIWSGILVESPEEATLKICCLECQGISSVSGWMREIQEVTPSPVHTIYCGMTPRNFSWSLCTNSKEVLVLKGMCHVCCNCGVSCIEIRNQSGQSLRFWTCDIQDLPVSCRKLLYFTFLFVFSILYTKNALKCAQFSRYNTTFFFDHFTVFLRTE